MLRKNYYSTRRKGGCRKFCSWMFPGCYARCLNIEGKKCDSMSKVHRRYTLCFNFEGTSKVHTTIQSGRYIEGTHYASIWKVHRRYTLCFNFEGTSKVHTTIQSGRYIEGTHYASISKVHRRYTLLRFNLEGTSNVHTTLQSRGYIEGTHYASISRVHRRYALRFTLICIHYATEKYIFGSARE